MSKKVIIPTITLVTLLAIGVIGSKVVSAEELVNTPPIVQKLAETFGLQEDEVEAVFDAVHDERKEAMQQNREEKLNQAITDGVLTEEQKQALLAHHQEMWQERQQERESHREEMEAWFEEQGIDHEALMSYMGGSGPRGGFGKMGKMHLN